MHPGVLKRLLDDEITRYIDPTLWRKVYEAELGLKRQHSQIRNNILEPYQDAINALTLEYEAVVANLEGWEEQADGLWSQITEELESAQPDLTDFENPRARPARNPEGFVLFDSKRDYLTQLDAYHEWQRGDG